MVNQISTTHFPAETMKHKANNPGTNLKHIQYVKVLVYPHVLLSNFVARVIIVTGKEGLVFDLHRLRALWNRLPLTCFSM